MSDSRRILSIITGLAIALAALACMAMTPALAQSGQATIVGQVTVNGTPTNGVLVTVGPSSNTTFTYNGTPGYYFVGGLPYETTLPFSATYQGQSYTDTVDPLASGQQYYQIPTVNVQAPVSTVTPTPVPNATATPAPNATATPAPNATATPAPTATVTPTPAPNATATPTPAPNATVTPAPNASITPAPLATTPTPVPPAPTNYPTSMPLVTITPIPTSPVTGLATTTPVPTLTPTVMPPPTAAAPAPTQTKSPGFEGLLLIPCLLGTAYLALRKGR
ncbi:MAG TPA: hypothetical protein VGJ92_11100 [Methanocella sp.]